MSSLVNLPGNNLNPARHSYDYYYNKIKKDKDLYGNVLPGDVYEKISNENIFKTLPGKLGAIYLIKKVTHEDDRWNKTRKWIGAAHGTIVIKYERIKKNGNVPIYLDEKPLTANFYTWGQWKKDFKFVGKIWNVEGEPQQFYSKDYNIEFLKDIARRQAYEDPLNKEEWKLRREEEEWKEKKREWLNSDEGRRWRAEEAKRKERFLRLPGKAWRMSSPHFQTTRGKALYEENRRWGEEYDRKEKQRKKEEEERLDREAEEKRLREEREEKEEEARQKAEIERRRRDEERRQHLERQAALWQRAEDVQRYLTVPWQYATEEEIEEAEREEEDEERRVKNGGGNPNDDVPRPARRPWPGYANRAMLPIPKLKF